MIAIGNFFFAHRNTAFPLLALLVLIPGPPIFGEPLGALAAGFVLAALGQSIRFATIGLRYIVRGGRNRRVYAQDLVTEGLYSHCRNPMYVGNLLILLGVALASNSWVCVALAVPLFIFIYASIIAAEENYLKKKFASAFDHYMRDVPRWIPRLRGMQSTFSDSQFHWRRVAVKEYGTPFGWISGLCLIGVVNLWRADQVDIHAGAIRVLAAIAALTLLGWILIRVLKKSRVLVAD